MIFAVNKKKMNKFLIVIIALILMSSYGFRVKDNTSTSSDLPDKQTIMAACKYCLTQPTDVDCKTIKDFCDEAQKHYNDMNPHPLLIAFKVSDFNLRLLQIFFKYLIQELLSEALFI